MQVVPHTIIVVLPLEWAGHPNGECSLFRRSGRSPIPMFAEACVFGGNHKWWRWAQDISTGYAKINSSKICRVRLPVKLPRFSPQLGECSENIQYEVMSAVEFATRGVVIVPMSVVDRDSHLGRIPIVEAISTPIVLVSPEILWVKDVRVVVEPVPIDGGVRVSPCAAICLLGLSFTRRGGDCERGHQEGQSPDLAEHGVSPCRM